MSKLRDSIRNSLKVHDEIVKKSVTINLEESILEDLRRIADKFNEVNKSKTFTRNLLIENAIESYIEEAKYILETDYNIDVNTDTESSIQEYNFDTVIFPAHNSGFRETFLNENCWYSVRINEKRIDKLKYVAIYRSAPTSGITHYAEIDKIEQYEDTDKKIIYFKSEAIELDNKINLGGINANSMRSPRYTTLKKLLCAKELKDLF